MTGRSEGSVAITRRFLITRPVRTAAGAAGIGLALMLMLLLAGLWVGVQDRVTTYDDHLGADLVVHSATKYLAGHSDALLGALVTRDDQLFTVLKQRRDLLGAVPGTLEAWLAVRGMRTLHLRVERAQANAAELARRLGEHPAVQLVRYPGFGAIVSVELAAGALAADLLPRKTRLWVHATSLGGVESTLERRRRWKSEPTTVSDALVRLSVGVEDVEDLWEDLSRALDGLTD